MIFYLLHQGAKGNKYYSLHLTEPRVTVRNVTNEKTGELTPLYETPDSFLFNFCLYGVERKAKVKFPLGSVTKLNIEFEQLETVAKVLGV